MKYKYDGETSQWLDISKFTMNQSSKQERVKKKWFKTILTFCDNECYELDDDKYDRIADANKFLKQSFLPSGEGRKSNPITAKPIKKNNGILTL